MSYSPRVGEKPLHDRVTLSLSKGATESYFDRLRVTPMG
jgi:hypothetical protein